MLPHRLRRLVNEASGRPRRTSPSAELAPSLRRLRQVRPRRPCPRRALRIGRQRSSTDNHGRCPCPPSCKDQPLRSGPRVLPKLAVRVRFPSPAPPFALVVQSGLARLSFFKAGPAGRRVERRTDLPRLIPPAWRAQRPAATTAVSPPATSSATLLASHEAISHDHPDRPCGQSHWPLASVSSSCSCASWCSPSHPAPDPAGLLPREVRGRGWCSLRLPRHPSASPYYPFWSLLVITLDVFVIWAIAAHGGSMRDARP